MPISKTMWMSDPYIQQKKIGEIVLPGTHDSGTYSLITQLSQVSYSDIKMLWDLLKDNAPLNNLYPWQNINPDTGQPYIYLGRNRQSDRAYKVPMEIAMISAQTQSSSILQQLNDGIRYFDLRIYYDTRYNDYFIQHALKGCPLQAILSDILAFKEQNKGNKELIFLELSHTNFRNGDGHAAAVSNLIKTTLGSLCIELASMQQLYSMPLSKFAEKGPAVCILNTDSITYPPPVSNFSFADSGRFNDNPGGVNEAKKMVEEETEGLKEHYMPGHFYQVQWNLTLQAPDIINSIIGYLSTGEASPAIKPLAQDANKYFYDFLNGYYAKYPFNVVTFDWYQYSNVADTILEFNHLH